MRNQDYKDHMANSQVRGMTNPITHGLINYYHGLAIVTAPTYFRSRDTTPSGNGWGFGDIGVETPGLRIRDNSDVYEGQVGFAGTDSTLKHRCILLGSNALTECHGVDPYFQTDKQNFGKRHQTAMTIEYNIQPTYLHPESDDYTSNRIGGKNVGIIGLDVSVNNS